MSTLQSNNNEAGFQLQVINIITELNIQDIIKAEPKECDILNVTY